MNIINAETVYDTLTDSVTEPYQVPGVENAFADGVPCARLYAQIYQQICGCALSLGSRKLIPMWS